MIICDTTLAAVPSMLLQIFIYMSRTYTCI